MRSQDGKFRVGTGKNQRMERREIVAGGTMMYYSGRTRLSGLRNGVKIKLRLMWVTFAIGTRWSALGVGVGLGEGREGRGQPSETRRERERDETGTEQN